MVPPRERFSLAGTGLEPRRNLLLADPVMSRLSVIASSFLEAPTPQRRLELERFATSHASHQAAALAYLALGYGAVLGKRWAEAAGYLRSGRAVSSPVPDYLDYYLAHSLAELGRQQEALELLEGFEQRYLHSSLVGRAVLARAGCWIATGRAAEAAEVLKSRLGALKRPEADMLLGRAYATARNLPAAVAAYRQVYYLYPNSEEADEAGQQAERLLSQAGNSIPLVPLEWRKQRADRLFEARQYRAATAAYQELAAAASGAAREQALVREAVAQYHSRAISAALAKLSRLHPAQPDADAERLYYLGECYRRRSRESKFLETVRRLGERHPASPWYEEALFSAGNYYLLRRSLPQAEKYYRSLCQRFPRGKYAVVAHWRVAWGNYGEGNLDEARRLFEEHVLRYPEDRQVAAALYWLGRLAERRGEPAQAIAYFRKVSEHFPNYFYGTAARQKLERAQVAGTTLPDNVAAMLASVPSYRPNLSRLSPPADLEEHQRKVQALEAAGLLDLAVLELRHPTDDTTHSQYLLLELARLERDRGNFLGAIVCLRRVFPNYFAFPFQALDRSYWELLFPLPWWSVVQANALRHGLDPYLVVGLIRQESAFDLLAVSRARALGLMQLLPSTARRVARQMGRGRPSRASLLDPVTSIELGCTYLRQVLDRYGGRLEAALAGYNAGPQRVDAWLAQEGYDDPLQFVESIPLTETRDYVQAVIRNAAIYRGLYADREKAAR